MDCGKVFRGVLMRELKFRAWRKDEKKMSEPFTILECPPEFQIHENDLVFLEYTGLHDKNGKEIYEGDLIKSPSGGISKIVWVDDFVCFSTLRVKETEVIGEFFSQENWQNLEVIGNIYSNPELLNTEK